VDRATAGDGTAIAFEVAGSGPDLVLVHGITESRRSWDPLIVRLSREHRVVALDLRGHGASERRAPYDALTMAADLAAVVETAGASAPMLVGHSLGGVVVSAYAAAGFPTRGVVNVDQPLALGGFKDALHAMEPALRGGAASCREAITAMFDVMYGPTPAAERSRLDAARTVEPDVVLGVWELVLSSSAEDLAATVEGVAGSVSVPYLSLHGTDPGVEYAGWLTALVPSAVVEVWPDHGHYPHLVDPERFCARVLELDRSL